MNINELKNKILQLAIQGKLVPQDENDIPASVLLEEIKKEKERLIEEKKIKKEKPLPEITEEEKPFNLPKGWQWVRLGEIGSYKKGPFGSTITKSMFVPKSEETIKVYEQKNAIQKNWTLGDYYVTKEYFEAKLKGFEVFEGDIIVSCAGTIGETYIMPQGIERGVINQALMKMNIFNGINIDYFLMYFESILKSTAKESSKGSAIKNIPPFDIFKKMLLAVPPVAEQLRIVQKVDELFSIIDELAENKEAMLKNISDTRNKVLQLAIQGKLVEQDENDEPVAILLERIAEERKRLIKEKKIKKEKPLPEITEEEKPFKLPKGWQWVRLGEIFNIKSSKRVYEKDYVDNGIPFYRSKEVGILSENREIENCYYISDEKFKDLKSKYGAPKKGDLLVTSVGTIGKCWIADEREFYYKDGNITQLESNEFICMNYIKKFINSNCFLEQVGKTVGGTAYNALTIVKFKNICCPLPSVAEQQRIVQKVDKIMAYLDELEKTII